MEISQEIIKCVFYTILPACIVMFCLSGIFYFQKDRIYRQNSTGWLDIKKNPIPEDIREFIATDGKTVECKFSVQWGRYGEVIFNNHKKTYITYWQPLPDVPKD